jgi:hypothetical protein
MTDNVHHLSIATTQNVAPDRVLEACNQMQYGLESVVIVGFTVDGDFYFASSEADSAQVLYFLERAKWELLKMEDRIYDEGDPRGRPPRGA